MSSQNKKLKFSENHSLSVLRMIKAVYIARKLEIMINYGKVQIKYDNVDLKYLGCIALNMMEMNEISLNFYIVN